MDDAQWRREYEAQTTYLRAQIHALLKRSPAKRLKFQPTVVWCQKCGNMLIEALDTDPYPCIRFRHLVGRQGAGEFASTRRETTKDWSTFFKNSSVSLHLDDWLFTPLNPSFIEDENAGRDELLTVACRCGSRTLAMSWVLRHVRQRSGRVVLPRP